MLCKIRLPLRFLLLCVNVKPDSLLQHLWHANHAHSVFSTQGMDGFSLRTGCAADFQAATLAGTDWMAVTK